MRVFLLISFLFQMLFLCSCSLLMPDLYDNEQDNTVAVIHDCESTQRDLTSSWDHNRRYWCDGRDRAGASHASAQEQLLNDERNEGSW